MQLVITNEQKVALLEILRSSFFDDGTLNVTLYENDHTPTQNDTIADYTFGTADMVLLENRMNPAEINADNKAVTKLDQSFFLTNDSAGPVTYYGVVIGEGNELDPLFGAAKFSTPITIPASGQREVTLLDIFYDWTN